MLLLTFRQLQPAGQLPQLLPQLSCLTELPSVTRLACRYLQSEQERIGQLLDVAQYARQHLQSKAWTLSQLLPQLDSLAQLPSVPCSARQHLQLRQESLSC